jgi:uncharacterized cupin superfamily protein
MRIKVERPDGEQLSKLGIASWSPWGCEVRTFDWHYEADETAYVLEGRVRVATPEGEVEFGKGDLVTFPAGLSCTWTVLEPIRKVYRFG